MDTYESYLAKQFTGSDRRRLRQGLVQARDVRWYRRLEAVLAIAEGESVLQAARRVHAERSTVHRWLRRYLVERSTKALAEGQRSGRPRVARKLSGPRLARLLERSPKDLGYEASSWTVLLLATHLRRQSIAISPRTLRRRIREARFRWKRPRYVYSERADHVGAKKGGSFAG